MPPKLKVAPRLPARRGAAITKHTDATSEAGASSSAAPAVSEPSGDAVSLEQRPIAPPKGRLDSLASARPLPAGLVKPGGKPGGLKVAPKVVARRSKEERERLDAKFQENKPDPGPDEFRPRSSSTRGPRGREKGRGRGRERRGGFGRDDPAPGASGPFALGSVMGTGRRKVVSERAWESSAPKKAFKFGKKFNKIKTEEGEQGDGENMEVKKELSSSEESDDERMNVEYISLLDDDEDEDGVVGWGTGAPVRVMRREHIDRQAMINTESSTKRPNKGVMAREMTFDTDIRIKDEPMEDAPDIPSSPELSKRKVKIEDSPEIKKKEPLSHGSPTRTRRRSRVRSKKPVVSTAEEREEYERELLDRKLSLLELGGIPSDSEKAKIKKVKVPATCFGATSPGPDVSEESDPNDLDAAYETPPHNPNAGTENQIFFFQFPKLLPQLLPAPIKPDPDAPKPDPDVVEVPAQPPATPVPKKTLTKRQLYKQQLALLTEPPAAGMVGRLRVHKSGRLTMLWGCGDDALEMEVGRATKSDYLQEVVVMKEESPYGDQDIDKKGNRKGVAYSLGQVKGKYLVHPDLVKLIKDTSGKKGKGKGKGKAKAKVKKDDTTM